MKAAGFVGGWEGHAPTTFADWYKALLEEMSIPDQKVPTRRRDLGQFPGFGRCLGACAPQ